MYSGKRCKAIDKFGLVTLRTIEPLPQIERQAGAIPE